jgi:WD40 repeat protein
MNDLSSEILAEVFSFLDVPSFVKACRTCKSWNSWINDEYFWKYFYNVEFKPQSLHRPARYSTWLDVFKKHHSYKSWRTIGAESLIDEVWSAKFSLDGQYLAATGKSGEIKIWKINHAPKERSIELKLHYEHTFDGGDGIGRIDWAPDASRLVITDKSDNVHLLEMKTLTLNRLSSCVADTYGQFLSSTTYVYTFSRKDEESALVRVDMDKNLVVFPIQSKWELQVGSISEDKKYLTYEHTSGISLFELWLLPTTRIKAKTPQTPFSQADFTVLTENGDMYGHCFSDKDRQLLVTAKDFRKGSDAPTIELHLWDIETKTIIRQWNLGDTDLHYLLYPSMTPDDQIALVGDDAGNVYLIHKECTEIFHKFKAHNALVNQVIMHPILDLLVTVSDTTEITFWTPSSSVLKAKFI